MVVSEVFGSSCRIDQTAPSVVSNFVVVSTNVGPTVGHWTVYISEAHLDFFGGTPFEQKEFDNGLLFAFDLQCHFSILTIYKGSQNPAL
jgi:hypothetical protein